MRILVAIWFVMVLADGGAATLMTWEALRKGAWKDYHSRYLGILFACFAVSRLIRLWRLVEGNPQELPTAWIQKNIAEATWEAFGMWMFYFYFMGKFDGTLQDRVGRRIGRLFKRKKDEQ